MNKMLILLEMKKAFSVAGLVLCLLGVVSSVSYGAGVILVNKTPLDLWSVTYVVPGFGCGSEDTFPAPPGKTTWKDYGLCGIEQVNPVVGSTKWRHWRYIHAFKTNIDCRLWHKVTCTGGDLSQTWSKNTKLIKCTYSTGR